jgi:hypothetical protein
MPSRDGQENKLNLKPLAVCSPLLLCLISGAARADLEPFSFGASEAIVHDDNLNRTDEAPRVAVWYSTTELRAAMDQAISRDRLTASAAVNYSDYRHLPDRNAFGYRGAVALDWSTIGDLSGTIGADSSRQQYFYGFNDDVNTPAEGKNLETDNHVFAKVSLGGPSRWNIFAGFDANQRNYSAETFRINEERQWSQSLGTTYSTSPDLSFGVTGSYTRGEYPNYTGPSNFSTRTLSGTTKWQASGNSSLSANLGYTTQDSDLQPSLGFVSGALNWQWTPPSHFTVNFGVSRSTDGGVAAGSLTTLNDRSINTSANLGVSYQLTAKISLTAGGQYAHRKYADVSVPLLNADGTQDGTESVSGVSHTSRFSLGAHYAPTRTTDLGCSGSREVRGSGSVQLVPLNYVDNSIQCTASIRFD